MRTKHDYPTIKHEFVVGDESIRELARKHDINAFSTIAERARNDDWAGARAQYRALQQSKTIEKSAERHAEKASQIRGDALEVVHAAILKMGADLEDRWVTDPETGLRVFVPGMKVTASDLAKLITQLQLLTGGATARTENLDLGLTGDVGDLPPELLRELLAISRAKGAGGEPVGQSPLPRIARAKPLVGAVAVTVGERV